MKLIDISGATVGAIPAKTYNGSSQKPAPTVTYDDETLKSGTDYSVSYKNNLYAGTATVTITGKGKLSLWARQPQSPFPAPRARSIISG